MEKFRLGRTELMVSRSGFGAIPIQRISFDDAKAILRHAYDSGINYFDTARSYTDSEEKLGYALADVRQNIIIATKSQAHQAAELFRHLETSLTNLKTDYIDVYQFHNPPFFPTEDHEIYQAALKAKKEGKIRFISVTSHRLELAKEMVASGIFDTLQFPLSILSTEAELEIIELCRKHDVGLIAMKAMSGGLITDPTATFAFLRKFGNIIPIWGIQHMWELEQFLDLEKNPPQLTAELLQKTEEDKKSLAGNFCRACGYCAPTCPAGINIPTAARMSLMLRRMSVANCVKPQDRADMEKIKDCVDCGECKTHCPYGLDTPNLLRSEYDFYQKFLKEHNL
jgi:aryl-alcohol dehydrogenase-like predicted oxidoreductase